MTFWVGRRQVKDLTAAERYEFVRKYHQEQNQIRLFVSEFEFVERKRVKSINEMTYLEQRQWMIFLKHERAEVLDLYPMNYPSFGNYELENVTLKIFNLTNPRVSKIFFGCDLSIR